jgi:hypothetical protein
MCQFFPPCAKELGGMSKKYEACGLFQGYLPGAGVVVVVVVVVSLGGLVGGGVGGRVTTPMLREPS